MTPSPPEQPLRLFLYPAPPCHLFHILTAILSLSPAASTPPPTPPLLPLNTHPVLSTCMAPVQPPQTHHPTVTIRLPKQYKLPNLHLIDIRRTSTMTTHHKTPSIPSVLTPITTKACTGLPPSPPAASVKTKSPLASHRTLSLSSLPAYVPPMMPPTSTTIDPYSILSQCKSPRSAILGDQNGSDVLASSKIDTWLLDT